MLGLGPVSSRSISGSPFKLNLVELTAIATGALLTFSGVTNPGITLPAYASGALVTLGGTAVPIWLQTATTTGTFLTLGGSATLELYGRPIVFHAIPEQMTFNAQSERFEFTPRADTITFRGMR